MSRRPFPNEGELRVAVRATEAQYLAPDFNPYRPPTVERALKEAGCIYFDRMSLAKAESYAAAGAAITLQAEQAVVGTGRSARFSFVQDTIAADYDGSSYSQLAANFQPLESDHDEYPYEQTGMDISRSLFSISSSLASYPQSHFNYLIQRHTEVGGTDYYINDNNRYFIYGGGTVSNEISGLGLRLRSAFERDSTPPEDRLRIAHDAAQLLIWKASINLHTHNDLKGTNPEHVRLAEVGRTHKLVRRNGDPIYRERGIGSPKTATLTCPAAHGRMLKHYVHAGVNLLNDRGLL